MIEIRKLTKKYGTFTAIRGIDIKVRAGEIFGFLGPNGAGKTTTIRIMAGLLQPTAGTVLIDGYDIQTHPVEAKAITGFIPDRPFLYEKMTGQEFLRFVCSLYGVNTEDVDEKIQRLLRVFEMENWKDELVESYSHGMRQRIVMSAALIHEPKAIIIDEPMVGLDPKGARLVKEIFKEQAQDRGVSIFMSTHTLEIAEEVCDRIAIIQEGRVIAEGTASDLKKRAGGGSYERLEAAFLRLTGGEDVRDITEVLGH